MRKAYWFLLIAILWLPSCSPKYVDGFAETDIDLYKGDGQAGYVYYTIPAGSPIKYKKTRRKSVKYTIHYDGYSGYAYSPKVSRNKKEPITRQRTDANRTNTPHVRKTYQTTTPAPETYRVKDVHVRGYYRKNGTYVRPHYRSSPRRR